MVLRRHPFRSGVRLPAIRGPEHRGFIQKDSGCRIPGTKVHQRGCQRPDCRPVDDGARSPFYHSGGSVAPLVPTDPRVFQPPAGHRPGLQRLGRGRSQGVGRVRFPSRLRREVLGAQQAQPRHHHVLPPRREEAEDAGHFGQDDASDGAFESDADARAAYTRGLRWGGRQCHPPRHDAAAAAATAARAADVGEAHDGPGCSCRRPGYAHPALRRGPLPDGGQGLSRIGAAVSSRWSGIPCRGSCARGRRLRCGCSGRRCCHSGCHQSNFCARRAVAFANPFPAWRGKLNQSCICPPGRPHRTPVAGRCGLWPLRFGPRGLPKITSVPCAGLGYGCCCSECVVPAGCPGMHVCKAARAGVTHGLAHTCDRDSSRCCRRSGGCRWGFEGRGHTEAPNTDAS